RRRPGRGRAAGLPPQGHAGPDLAGAHDPDRPRRQGGAAVDGGRGGEEAVTATAQPPNGNGSRALVQGMGRWAEAQSAPRRDRQKLLGDADPDYCFADFLWKIATKDAAGLRKVYGAEKTKAALGETPGGAGGYLVPTEFALDIMADVGEDAL